MKKAFSLVELSIVLVILGLLVGGILAGQSLIRASELRSITAQYDQFRTASFAFKDKYLALPGDISNATNFWGQSTALCDCTVDTNGTCNGNGNGIIDDPGSVYEQARFWRHLNLAGLIPGTYNGSCTSLPSGKMGNTQWFTATKAVTSADNERKYNSGSTKLRHSFVFVGMNENYVTRTGYSLTPNEAWNIDTKIDDGMASDGKLIGYPRANVAPSCGISNWHPSAYNLAEPSRICSLMFFAD